MATASAADPVVFSFAFFGCNRVDKEKWDPRGNPSSANLPQLKRNFADIAALNPRPSVLFVTGDLVLGYGDDQGEGVRAQLNAWMEEYRQSPLSGKIELVPVAGNHELNRKVGKDKLESTYTTKVWNNWLVNNKLTPRVPNGPTFGGPDDLADDQSRLNFTLERGPFHFVVLNTDARVKNGKIGWTPGKWAAADIRRATAHRRNVFVVGHRNLVDPVSVKGDAPIDPEVANPLIECLTREPSVLGYLCAHVHAWDLSRINGTGPWQVVAGNGGSTLEKDWHPAQGTTFGFGVIGLHKSGKVTLTQYQREANAMYSPLPAIPAPEITLATVSAKPKTAGARLRRTVR